MGWLSNLMSGRDETVERERSPAERILQLRRGISAAAAALPSERSDVARDAVDAADELADRVAAMVETPGPEEDIEVETPSADVDAAGWLREGPARRREAGGPAGPEVADEGSLPDDVAREGARLLSELHFSLLRMEILDADSDSLPTEEAVEEIRELAGRLPEPAGNGERPASGDGGEG